MTATVGHEACVSDLSKNRENREDHSLKQNFVFVMLHCDTIQLLVFLAFTVSAKGLILYFNPCQHPGIYIGQSEILINIKLIRETRPKYFANSKLKNYFGSKI